MNHDLDSLRNLFLAFHYDQHFSYIIKYLYMTEIDFLYNIKNHFVNNKSLYIISTEHHHIFEFIINSRSIVRICICLYNINYLVNILSKSVINLEILSKTEGKPSDIYFDSLLPFVGNKINELGYLMIEYLIINKKYKYLIKNKNNIRHVTIFFIKQIDLFIDNYEDEEYNNNYVFIDDKMLIPLINIKKIKKAIPTDYNYYRSMVKSEPIFRNILGLVYKRFIKLI